jgi:hypothetical protein
MSLRWILPEAAHRSDPTTAHREIADVLGSSPHVLSNSGTIRERNGHAFGSNAARIAVDTLHDALLVCGGQLGGHRTGAGSQRQW